MTTLPQPIGRVAYLGRLILSIIASASIYVAFTWAAYFAEGRGTENMPVVLLCLAIWVVAFLFFVMSFVRFVIIARLTSIGANRWWALLLLVPYVSIMFMLVLLVYPPKVELRDQTMAQPSGGADAPSGEHLG